MRIIIIIVLIYLGGFQGKTDMMNDGELWDALYGPETESAPPDCLMRRTLWMSRLYLSSLINGQPTPQWLASMLDGPADRHLLRSLMRVWDHILATTDERLVLHNPDCPCVSPHEQALVTGIRCLQKANGAGYEAAMASVLPAASVRLTRPAVQDLADTLVRLERISPPNPRTAAASDRRLAVIDGGRRVH